MYFSYLICVQVKQKTKLWGKLDSIVGHKKNMFGSNKYRVKLVGVTKEIWVQAADLSKGCSALYTAGVDLPVNAKVRVDRGHVIVQRKFFKSQKGQDKDQPSACGSSFYITNTELRSHPIRKKNARLVFNSASLHRRNEQDFGSPT